MWRDAYCMVAFIVWPCTSQQHMTQLMMEGTCMLMQTLYNCVGWLCDYIPAENRDFVLPNALLLQSRLTLACTVQLCYCNCNCGTTLLDLHSCL